MSAILRRVRRSGRQAGFTLTELLVVVLLLGVVGSVVGSGLVSSMRADRKTRARVSVTGDLTKGVDRMTKQIRVAAPVVDFSATSLTVETYRNGLRYRYAYTYNVAAKTVSETLSTFATANAVSPSSQTTQTLLRNVSNGSATPMFKYYDRNGTAATQIKDIARVELTLVEKPQGDAQGPISFSTSVFLRNYREM
ncbi:MAG TPA: prepilin-type N-terminal cleavage/methylation domain-containing protein [Frankiaceae bacterium]|jgi:prepilin-type N-terminal cleavage/methylation domain-containing protein|nr:prepilin-type N-terminal cleavage/methylation domain-containing protein [Frankiaceae bacterium]